MVFFSRSCDFCRSKENLSDYIALPVKTKILDVESIQERDMKNMRILLNTGEVIKPDLWMQWGDVYCYWILLNEQKEVHFCSKKCSIKFSKGTNQIVIAKGNTFAVENIIFPHQEQMEEYKKRTEKKDRGVYVGGKRYVNPNDIIQIGQMIKYNKSSGLIHINANDIWWDFYSFRDNLLEFKPSNEFAEKQNLHGKSMVIELEEFKNFIFVNAGLEIGEVIINAVLNHE